MSKLEAASQNMQSYPKIVPISCYPAIPLYADKDGYWYWYTIWHLEQLTK
jgi:hypothetical protein